MRLAVLYYVTMGLRGKKVLIAKMCTEKQSVKEV